MFGIPIAALVGCLASALTLAAVLAVVATEYLAQQQEDHTR